MMRYRWLIVTCLLVLMMGSAYYGAREALLSAPLELSLDERSDGYFTLVDAEGSILLITGRILSIGDKFTSAEGQEYVVFRIEGDTAHARYLSAQTMRTLSEYSRGYQTVQAEDPPTVGILHTHSAESYVPTDGTDSIASSGGILKVGETFSESLKEKGLNVHHDTTGHEPHDAGAYARARRTASDLLRKGADVIFDVHRDAAPEEAYLKEINGRPVTQVLLVVGRQNPKSNTNMAFARRLKNVANEEHPGLVKGILQARGSYNQDLTDRMVLLEVGAHTNEREHAQDGVMLLANAVPAVLGATDLASTESRSGLVTLAWGLLLLVLAIGAYLYISTGSWEGMKAKLEHLRKREFAEFFPRRSRPDPGDES